MAGRLAVGARGAGSVFALGSGGDGLEGCEGAGAGRSGAVVVAQAARRMLSASGSQSFSA